MSNIGENDARQPTGGPSSGMDVQPKKPNVYRLFIAALILILFGTGVYQYARIYQNRREMSALEKKNEQLATEQENLRNYIADVTATVNEVSLKLHEVRQKQVDIQGLINTPEMNGSQRDRMLVDLHAIQGQLDYDKRSLKDLQKKMEASKVRIASLERMVKQLKDEIELNQSTIAGLREALRGKEYALNRTRDSLAVSRNDLVESRRVLDESRRTLEDTRNTAYFVMGRPDELKKKNIIERHGLIWWKHSELTSRFELGDFQKIDITEKESFVLDRKTDDIKVIPERDRSSYELKDSGDGGSVLRVKDRSKFWKVPYLVVVID